MPTIRSSRVNGRHFGGMLGLHLTTISGTMPTLHRGSDSPMQNTQLETQSSVSRGLVFSGEPSRCNTVRASYRASRKLLVPVSLKWYKSRAHRIIERWRKRFKPPQNCSLCNQHRRVNGHHLDYQEALTVVWLCPPCHAFVHSSVGKSTDLTGIKVDLSMSLSHNDPLLLAADDHINLKEDLVPLWVQEVLYRRELLTRKPF